MQEPLEYLADLPAGMLEELVLIVRLAAGLSASEKSIVTSALEGTARGLIKRPDADELYVTTARLIVALATTVCAVDAAAHGEALVP